MTGLEMLEIMTPIQIAEQITPGSVVAVHNTQIFVKGINAQLILYHGMIITGTKITKDGFIDMRSHGKDIYYISFSDIRTIISPEKVHYTYPKCQLRP